ncbi:MAG: extracellular solute-binding protein [Opitutaceae bacterium]|nr:extracellular solute-binding protein [Opitutaceae bacterium]
MSLFARLRQVYTLTTPAVWILAALGLIAAAVVFSRPASRPEGLVFWLFSRSHQEAYQPVLKKWNAARPTPASTVTDLLLDGGALERRLLSGFMSGTPVADLVELERGMAGRAFSGPVEDIGFVDLTERLREEGLMDTINAPSFGPWTSRGRIFGLPHDVHPVLLAYRSDIVEAAGIDLSTVETWDDFFRLMRPLMTDENGDGRPDRYILNFWATNGDVLEAMVLQAGGGFFDDHDRLALDTEINARVVATLATWTGGPGRISVDAPEFSAPGNTLRLRGVVLASIMPDWLAGVWKMDLPELAGKVKLMPLPAWEKGGRRTSVQGGTMLGISRRSADPEAAWEFAKRLYLDRETHAKFFASTTIIPPVRSSWDHPVFARPDPYFGGQPVGTMFIEQAAHVPRRASSPYNALARSRLNDVLLALVARVNREQITDPEVLLPETRRLLSEAQTAVQTLIHRNVFLRTEAP